MKHLRPLLFDALIALVIVLVASGLGVAYNLVAGGGLDPFATYDGYGDPPTPTEADPFPLPPVGITKPLPVADAVAGLGALVFVDARGAEEFKAGHIPGAVSVPYSLRRMMVPKEQGGGYTDDELAPLKAACHVVVYDGGDGSAETVHADLKEQLPVFQVLTGGVEAWKQAGGAWTGGEGGE